MDFKLLFTDESKSQFYDLKNSPELQNRFKAVRKTLALMETNLRHPSLKTHKYSDLKAPDNKEVFESYAENNTPGAYRIFWYYGPNKEQITILTITSHP